MLKIGWSRRDVSTTEPVLITGQFHLRVSKGVIDPITLNCLVVEDENDIAIFLSGDFVSPGKSLDDIRAAVKAKNSNIPVEKILFNVTHTHCGAGIMKTHAFLDIPHEGLDIYHPLKYYEFLLESASDAIVEAYENRAEGAIAYGYGYAVVSHSRRTTYYDDYSKREDGHKEIYNSLQVHGHAVMYGPTNDDQFKGFEGGADHFVNIMFTFDKERKLTGAIINVPCPSQNSEHEYYLTADFWHDTREMIRAKYGDIHILAQCAAAGDLSPREIHYLPALRRRYELKYADTTLDERASRPLELLRRKDIAERISNAFDEVYSWAKKDIITEAKVRHSVKTLTLDRWLIDEEAYKFACDELAKIDSPEFAYTDDPEKDFFDNSLRLTAISRFKNIISRYEDQLKNPTTNMELHTIQIGDIAFASNPFELYIDYQHQIQARSPFIQTFVIQLCATPNGNYLSGYLATERGEENVGYSANIYSNQVYHTGAETLVKETLEELNRLHSAE